MAAGLYEAVPNFSTAGEPQTLAALVAAFEESGASVVDVHEDAHHGRSVVTAVGSATQLERGCVDAVAEAVARIDLRAHAGAHPRVGACDVMPIVPLDDLHPAGGGLPGAVQLARSVAARVGRLLPLPVLLYGAAASGPGQQPRAAHGEAAFAGMLRLGGSAGLAARLAAGELHPHAGPAHLHPTAGALLVGAREVLVAFNVEVLAELDVARAIAADIRERGGGLPGVRALGLDVPGNGRVQVSTNVERWRDAGPARVFERIAELAHHHGASITSVELVGLAPQAALAQLDDVLRGTGVQLRSAPRPAIEDHLPV